MKKVFIFLASLLVFLAALWFGLSYMQEQKSIKQYAFELNSADGTVQLSDFKGKMPIIYFGYMYCPDICPTTLSLAANALEKLPKESADKFQLIFISVDPTRDGLEDLKKYAQYFYPDAIGLSADEKHIKKLTQRYGTYYAKEYDENSSIGYSVSHTTFLYFLDTKGKLVQKIKHPQSSDEILEVLQDML